MKKLLLITLFILHKNFAQSKINYVEKGYEDAIEQSKTTKKPILLMAYADWCDHCKKMRAEVLIDTTVINFINKNYIPAQVNSDSIAGKKIVAKYNIKSYPVFLFLDENGSELYNISGEFKVKDFLEELKTGLNPQKQFPYLKAEFEKDNNNAISCINYMQSLKKGKDKEKIDEIAKQYLDKQPNPLPINKINWRVIIFGVNDFDSKEFQYVLEKKDAFAAITSEKRVNTKIVSVLNKKLKFAVEKNDTISYNKYRKLGENLKINSVDSLIFHSDIKILENNKNWKTYKKVTQVGVEKFAWTNPKILNEICANYFKNVTEITLHKKALEWAKHSSTLKESYDTKLLLAFLSYKVKDTKNAFEYAKIAKEYATKNNLDTKTLDKLIDKISPTTKGGAKK